MENDGSGPSADGWPLPSYVELSGQEINSSNGAGIQSTSPRKIDDPAPRSPVVAPSDVQIKSRGLPSPNSPIKRSEVDQRLNQKDSSHSSSSSNSMNILFPDGSSFENLVSSTPDAALCAQRFRPVASSEVSTILDRLSQQPLKTLLDSDDLPVATASKLSVHYNGLCDKTSTFFGMEPLVTPSSGNFSNSNTTTAPTWQHTPSGASRNDIHCCRISNVNRPQSMAFGSFQREQSYVFPESCLRDQHKAPSPTVPTRRSTVSSSTKGLWLPSVPAPPQSTDYADRIAKKEIFLSTNRLPDGLISSPFEWKSQRDNAPRGQPHGYSLGAFDSWCLQPSQHDVAWPDKDSTIGNECRYGGPTRFGNCFGTGGTPPSDPQPSFPLETPVSSTLRRNPRSKYGSGGPPAPSKPANGPNTGGVPTALVRPTAARCYAPTGATLLERLQAGDAFVYKVPVMDLLALLKAPLIGHKMRLLQLLVENLLRNVDHIPPGEAADLLRLPAKTIPNTLLSRRLCERLLQVPLAHRGLTSMQIALVFWSLAKDPQCHVGLVSNEPEFAGIGHRSRPRTQGASSGRKPGANYNVTKILNSLAEEAILCMSQFQPLSIANLLWACGKLKYYNEALLASITAAAARQLPNFNAQNIANTFWSLGTLEYDKSPLTPAPGRLNFRREGGDDSYEVPVIETLWSKFPTFNSQALANFIWACAKLHWCNVPLLLAAAREAVQRTSEFKPQEVANLMWGLAKLGMIEAIPVVEHFGNVAAPALRTFNSQEVSNAYWAIGTLEIRTCALTPWSLATPAGGATNCMLVTSTSTAAASSATTWENDEIAGSSTISCPTLPLPSPRGSSIAPIRGDPGSGTVLEVLPQAFSLEPKAGTPEGNDLDKESRQRTTLLTATAVQVDGDDSKGTVLNEATLTAANHSAGDPADRGRATAGPLSDQPIYRASSPSSLDAFSSPIPQTGSFARQPISLPAVAATTADTELLATIVNKMSQFNSQAVANLLWACGKLQWHCPEVCEASIAVVNRNIHSFRPQNIANFLWAIAKLKYRNLGLVRTLTQAALCRLDEFNTQELANVYWAIGTLEIRDTCLTPPVAALPHEHSDDGAAAPFNSVQASKFSREHKFSYDATVNEDNKMGDINFICRNVKPKLRAFRPQETANFLWACARLRWKPPILLEEATETALRSVSSFKPQEISNLVWALAKLNYRCIKLLRAMCDIVAHNLECFTPQNIANIYWALGHLSFLQTELTDDKPDQRCLRSLLRIIRSFNEQEVANFLWACGRLRWNQKDIIACSTEVVRRQLPRLRKLEINNLIWAYKKLGRPDVAMTIEAQQDTSINS